MNLEGVEKTMLLTLFAKAQHSQEKNHKFYDKKAKLTLGKTYYYRVKKNNLFIQIVSACYKLFF